MQEHQHGQQTHPEQQPMQQTQSPQYQQQPVPMQAVSQQVVQMQPAIMPAPTAVQTKPKTKLGEKTQSPIFSTIVKALCLLILLAAFLPFGTVSCGPMMQVSVSGYDLALGNAASDAEAFADIGQLGMGMGAGQLAALNMLAGVNLLLLAAFVGTAMLFVLSLGLGRTRLEMTFALMVAAFSLAAYLQWLGIFSAFTGMFDTAAERGGAMMSAGPDIGLYAVIVFSSLLLVAAGLEAIGKLPTFQSDVPDAMQQVPQAAPANVYYQQVPQQQPMQQQPQPQPVQQQQQPVQPQPAPEQQHPQQGTPTL